MPLDELISGMLREEGGFQKALRQIIIKELRLTLNEFCHATGISQSTMYKIMEEKREPNLRTIRSIYRAVKMLIGSPKGPFIAIIASHQMLQNLVKEIDIAGHTVILREYPVSTVEDAIISAVRAERDGALGVVCAPIVAPTIERILTIPVSPVIPTESVRIAVEKIHKDLM